MNDNSELPDAKFVFDPRTRNVYRSVSSTTSDPDAVYLIEFREKESNTYSQFIIKGADDASHFALMRPDVLRHEITLIRPATDEEVAIFKKATEYLMAQVPEPVSEKALKSLLDDIQADDDLENKLA